MEIEKIKEYAKLMEELSLTALEIGEGAERVRLERRPKRPPMPPAPGMMMAPMPGMMMPMMPMMPPAPGMMMPPMPGMMPPHPGCPHPEKGGKKGKGKGCPEHGPGFGFMGCPPQKGGPFPPAFEPEGQENAEKESVEDDGCEVKSPMVGMYYNAPAEDAEPFVKLGQKVKKGDTLCIIEAMKLMNEITAEKDGTVKEICAENGQVVEYGTLLFRIED